MDIFWLFCIELAQYFGNIDCSLLFGTLYFLGFHYVWLSFVLSCLLYLASSLFPLWAYLPLPTLRIVHFLTFHSCSLLLSYLPILRGWSHLLPWFRTAPVCSRQEFLPSVRFFPWTSPGYTPDYLQVTLTINSSSPKLHHQSCPQAFPYSLFLSATYIHS